MLKIYKNYKIPMKRKKNWPLFYNNLKHCWPSIFVEHLVNLRLILIHKNDLNNSNSTINHTVTPPLLQIVFNSAATKYANRIAYEQ